MRDVNMKFKYADETTRNYSFSCEDSLAPDVKDNIKAVNSSLKAGTDDGLADFFVSDAGENFVLIEGATVVSVVSTPIDIAPNS